MATRKNTFLLKRSNVAGNVPTAGQIILGELALNTADVKLYASGTTTNSILPIGWDRISRTGDTMTGSFSAPTISATTYYNLPSSTFTGGTVNGPTIFTAGLSTNTISATTYLNLPVTTNTFVTATTFNNGTYDLNLTRNDGVILTSNLGILATDVRVTGGTYNINTGVVTFTNSTGGTFGVTGFSSGMTDTFVTGGTYNAGTATFTRSNNDMFNVTGFNTGTVTSVAALTLGTSGTDVNSSVASGTTTPVITLNIPDASATARGVITTGAQTIAGTKTFSPSVTAASAIARGTNLTPTLLAAANNDTLVGLDIQPTFTNGAFTGVNNLSARINGNVLLGQTPGNVFNYTPLSLVNNGTAGQLKTQLSLVNGAGSAGSGSAIDFFTYTDVGNGLPGVRVGVVDDGSFSGNYQINSKLQGSAGAGALTTKFQMYGGTGNLVLQNGGTFTDAGFRLDVFGLNRFVGTTATDTAPLGVETAAVTGTGANWTLIGTNLNVDGYTHTVGAVTPLTTTLAAAIGTFYQINYTITGRTAGAITISYGGQITGNLASTGSYGPLATTTGVLIITPTIDFDGNVAISIKTIGASSALSTFANSSAISSIEVRPSSLVSNTFIGLSAGRRNTTGVSNTFYGVGAGGVNTTGFENTFIGRNSGNNNTVGTSNTLIGASAGVSNTTGVANTFVGVIAGNSNTTGGDNVGVGVGAAHANTTGANNISIGRNAARFIANGSTLATVTNNSIFIGHTTKPLADSQTNQIVIGYNSTGLGSNTTVLGNASTTATAIYGNLLVGTTVDDGVNKLQVSGNARINGGLTATTISATTYQNLPSSAFTGGTVTGPTNFTGGLTANTISATTVTANNFTGLASLATSATTALNSTQLNGQLASFYYPASNPNGYTTNTGTVTGVNSGNGMNFTNFTTSGTITLGTPSSTTLASTNAVTTNSHTHAFAPGGTAAQYITGAGTLVTFPTIVNTFVTGSTINNSTYDLTLTRNDGVTIVTNLGILATDVRVTGGTYNINTGVVTFTNSTGGTFNVTGFSSGMTDTFVTGGTYAGGTATFTRSNNASFNVTGFNTGTVTSVGALTVGTSGTDLSSSVANGTTTPVITLNVPTASAANRGALSATDWSTFNSKQPQLNGTGFVKAVGTTISYDNSTYYLASNPNGYTTNTGTVTAVNSGNGMNFTNFTTSGTITMGTPSSTTLVSTNATTTNSHTHAFAPGGTAAQYITGAGTLVTFPTITNGTVTSVAALTLGTTGTDLNSTVANPTTTPVITLNVPDASATARGVINNTTQTIAGTKTFNNTINGTVGSFSQSSAGVTLSANNGGVGGIGVSGGAGNGLGGYFVNNSTTYPVVRLLGLSNTRLLEGRDTSDVITFAVTSAGAVSGSSFIRTGGTSAQFLKADGTVDSTTYVPTSRTLTINGTTFDLSANRSWTIAAGTGTVTQVNSGNGMNFSNFTTSGTITLGTPSSLTLSSTNAVTSTSHTHAFAPGGTTAQYITGAGTLVTFPTITNGTVTSVAALTLGTTGTDLSSTVANGSTTPVITLNVPTASAANRGALSSTDWSTFNGKQAALNGTGFVKIVGTTISYDNSTYYLASNPNGYTTNTGTVTGVNSGNGMNFTNFTTSGTITMGTPSSLTLSSTNSVTSTSHTHAFAPGGTAAQYITGAGALATFPTIPTVNDGTLTLATSGIATGSASFTANQAGTSTFTVNVPATDLTIGSNTGTVVRVDSSTGTDATLPLATASLAGVVTNAAQTFGGIKTFNDEVVIENSIIESQNGGSFGVGSTVVYSRNVTSETAFFFDYVLTSGANARAGSLMVVINGSSIEFNETSTNDIGSTSSVTLKPSIGGGTLRLNATSTSGTWTFKSVTRIL